MKLDEIARLAGVSRTTASYVINARSSIVSAIKPSVMAVVREHNYHPECRRGGCAPGVPVLSVW
ncbi:LacI family DNA-binding transcriptional regulator [Serratia marcescens]|uniref:LacI family DNA-binding transcriptional regulator n=1 Tax=Serratia marcescens TaxID=615 RepID=A0A939SUK2_SERMA|nr:LacI family DNA-binding transcriptional regulator [Serratia marcescens]